MENNNILKFKRLPTKIIDNKITFENFKKETINLDKLVEKDYRNSRIFEEINNLKNPIERDSFFYTSFSKTNVDYKFHGCNTIIGVIYRKAMLDCEHYLLGFLHDDENIDNRIFIAKQDDKNPILSEIELNNEEFSLSLEKIVDIIAGLTNYTDKEDCEKRFIKTYNECQKIQQWEDWQNSEKFLELPGVKCEKYKMINNKLYNEDNLIIHMFQMPPWNGEEKGITYLEINPFSNKFRQESQLFAIKINQ